MPSSLDLPNITDAPEQIIRFAQNHPEVTINLRADHWPKELVAEARADKCWGWRIRRYCGLLMYPGLTTFLTNLNVGSGVVVCHQDPRGRIFTTKGTVREVFWVGQRDDCGARGVLASIRFDDLHSVDQIWGSFILAVGTVPPTRGSRPVQDPDGSKFIRTYQQLHTTTT